MFYAYTFQFNFSIAQRLENAARLVFSAFIFSSVRFHTFTTDALVFDHLPADQGPCSDDEI